MDNGNGHHNVHTPRSVLCVYENNDCDRIFPIS